MLKNPSFIFDIVCTAVWLILVIRYYRKGFLAAVVQLLGNLACLAAASALAKRGAALVFQNFLAGHFRAKIAQSIAAEGGSADLAAIAEQYAGFLPQSLREQIVAAAQQSIEQTVAANAAALADAIVSGVIQPLLTPIIALALFFVAYALLRMLLSLLETVLGLINRLPVLGAVNRWLGMVVGGIASLVDIYLVLCVVWGIIVITGGSLTVLNDTVMSTSLYYKAFNLFNPFI